MSAPTRRAVLRGAALTCGAGLLGGCGGGDGAEVASPGGGALALLSDVPVGGAVTATTPDGTKVLVAQPTEGRAVAFSSVCTHQGCAVSPEDGVLSCPCHGSQFDPATGEVRRGPAERPLAPYAVKVEDGKVVPA